MRETPACVRSRMDSGKYQGLFGLAIGILVRLTVLPKYKPWLDQTQSDIFPNRAKICTITYKYCGSLSEQSVN